MGDYYIVPILIAIVGYIYCSVGLKKLQNPKPEKPAAAPNYQPLPISPPMTYYAPGADIFPEPPEKDDEPYTMKETVLEEFLLDEFDIGANVLDTTHSPNLSTYHVNLDMVRDMKKLPAALKALKMRLKLDAVQAESEIADFSITIPRTDRQYVYLRDVMETIEFDRLADNPDAIPAVIGVDDNNEPVCIDLAKAPHFLVVGTTGSGKSVCVNSMLLSALARRTPDQLQVVLIDVKRTELTPYNSIPHLKPMTFLPAGGVGMEGAYVVKRVITEAGDADTALRAMINEMEARYEEAERNGARGTGRERPHILIIIDELADLMMNPDYGKSIERSIVRLAQLARAARMHLICSTQSPTAKVTTSLIRANLPARLAFKVSTPIESRIAFSKNGAEKLLGNGDGYLVMGGDRRIQAAYSDMDDVAALVEYYLESGEPYTENDIEQERNRNRQKVGNILRNGI